MLSLGPTTQYTHVEGIPSIECSCSLRENLDLCLIRPKVTLPFHYMENLPDRIGTSPDNSMCDCVAGDTASKLCSVEPKHQADSSFYTAETVQYLIVHPAVCTEVYRRPSIAHPVARHRDSEGYALSGRSGQCPGRIARSLAG